MPENVVNAVSSERQVLMAWLVISVERPPKQLALNPEMRLPGSCALLLLAMASVRKEAERVNRMLVGEMGLREGNKAGWRYLYTTRRSAQRLPPEPTSLRFP